jgi:hypothetical protein
VENVARGGNCLFRMFRPFVTYEIIQNNMRLRTNTREVYKMHMGKLVYSDNLETVAISEIEKKSVSVYFVSEGQITPPSTVIFG